MLASSVPTKVAVIWGAGAGGSFIRTVPVPSQIGITGGAASFTDGFPPLCFDAVGSGGIPPAGQDFNGAFNAVTAWNQWQSAGGLVAYDSVFSSAVGGYPKGALLAKAAGGGLWLSQVDNNTTDPDTGGAGWTSLGSGPSVTILTSGSGTYTVPPGTTWLEIEMIGGGSGGGGAGTTTTGGAGGAGGNTTFGSALLVANGGPATPTSSVTAYPTPAVATGSTDIVSGGLGGGSQTSNNNTSVMTASGGLGASSFYGSGAPGGTSASGTGVVLPGTAVAPGSGGGGGAITANVSAFTGWGGNAGAFLRAIITTPAASYAYAVGAGGLAGTAGTSGSAGSTGAAGYLRIIAH